MPSNSYHVWLWLWQDGDKHMNQNSETVLSLRLEDQKGATYEGYILGFWAFRREGC